ncbi:pteridine reductase [Neptuniibacter halophilus]|uniref:pteridine reductase n=1 Tax=Neptuniibacter halophilus TaxID=651666 RepID=UPI0025740C92|nr:pteridine reductase [Neptuniibacter halophilus]
MSDSVKTALITGSARRVGAHLAERFHQAGYRIALHYRSSEKDARTLCSRLNSIRPDSCEIFQADLHQMEQIQPLADAVLAWAGEIDLLLNNASEFYPTPLQDSSQEQWDQLINSNLRAPYFLCAALAPSLHRQQGCIINMIDIHAQRGLPGYPIYSIAKAGLEMLTKSLAKEMAPAVRVNGISPGPILWPEQAMTETEQQSILQKTLLQRLGSSEDLAEAAIYLAAAGYVTGQIIAVDGGKSLYSH